MVLDFQGVECSEAFLHGIEHGGVGLHAGVDIGEAFGYVLNLYACRFDACGEFLAIVEHIAECPAMDCGFGEGGYGIELVVGHGPECGAQVVLYRGGIGEYFAFVLEFLLFAGRSSILSSCSS